uniref:Uncharacterized protein n=1 Tax=Timema shepardi TaxID=629360 RepID=A0A7R9G060_TIMSH|nr:unnamed protein product [Timema shepardi]
MDSTMTLSYKLHHSGTKQSSSLTLTDYTMALSYKLHHSGTKLGSSLTLTDYTMALSYKLHHSGTKQGSSLTLTDYTMALSYKLHHSGTKQGSSLTLTDYTMALSYKLHHSGTKQGSSFTLTDYTMALSYKLHHSGTKQGSSLTLTDYTMALSYKPHHSGTKHGSSLTLTEYTMTLSYKPHHSGTKHGSSLTLTEYTMTLSYKLYHSGTKHGISLTLTEYTMTLSYKLYHIVIVQGSCKYHEMFPTEQKIKSDPSIDKTILSASVLAVIEVVISSVDYEMKNIPFTFPKGASYSWGYSIVLAWLVFILLLVSGFAFMIYSRKRKGSRAPTEEMAMADEPTIIGRRNVDVATNPHYLEASVKFHPYGLKEISHYLLSHELDQGTFELNTTSALANYATEAGPCSEEQVSTVSSLRPQYTTCCVVTVDRPLPFLSRVAMLGPDWSLRFERLHTALVGAS